MSVVALYYGNLDYFAMFFVFFVVCVTAQSLKKLGKSVGLTADTFVVDSVQSKKHNRFGRVANSVMTAPLLSYIFEHEYQSVDKIVPYTGQIVDSKYFVQYTAIVTLIASIIIIVVAVSVVIVTTGITYILLSVFTPLLIPLMAPVSLHLKSNARREKSSSELLPFLTYLYIAHTVNKTLFWAILSISKTDMFAQLRDDANVVLRFAKQVGIEEGASITDMARFHPNKQLKIFLERYVSYIGTNTTRLGNYVDITREEALQDTIKGIQGYTNSANTVFFMGTMLTSILPVMLTVMAFLPNSGVDAELLVGVMFLLPMVFVVFPALVSVKTIFLQTDVTVFKLALLAGACCFALLYLLTGNVILAASLSIAVASGISYAKTAKKESLADAADKEIPDMLDYIAEQKKSKNSMIEIFQDYARLPTGSIVLKQLLQGVTSDILAKSSYDAFLADRPFPNRTIKFVFFILHAIYEHGGGTYETTIAMAHSIRRIVEMKRQFVSSVRFSVLIVVFSPAVFMFAVIMTSFMTFGVPSDAVSDDIITTNVLAIQMTDVQNTVESLKPICVIIAVTGGLGVSKITHYTFKHTKYLLLTTAVSSTCLLLWDVTFEFMQSLTGRTVV